jgi:uncharacterized membrane protein YqhA
MVKLEFQDLETYTAELSLIIISILLIVLMSVFPSPNTTEIYKDLLFIMIGALAGIVGGKQIAKSNEVAEEKEDDVA